MSKTPIGSASSTTTATRALRRSRQRSRRIRTRWSMQAGISRNPAWRATASIGASRYPSTRRSAAFRARRHRLVECAWFSRSRLEIEHASTTLYIDRYRDLVVHDHPVAVELLKAGRPSNPIVGPIAMLQFAANAIETPSECYVVAHRERELANLVTERRLIGREDVYPVFQFGLRAHVLERRHEVE